jgi:hypothetical protein
MEAGTVHCGENSRIFRDAADQTLSVTGFSEIYISKIKFSHLSRNIHLQVTFGLLHLGKSGSFRHGVVSAFLPACIKLPKQKKMVKLAISQYESTSPFNYLIGTKECCRCCSMRIQKSDKKCFWDLSIKLQGLVKN